jgi:Flp pilus assembly protein TadG
MINKLIASLHRRGADREKGTIAVEFAFAAPVLITLALGAADYGSLMNTSASLRGATRAGAEYAKANWNNPSVTNPTTATEQQVCGFLGLTLSGGSCSPVTPSVATACTCDDNSSVTPCPPTGTNPCASNANPGVLLYVTVTATQSFTPILSWPSFAFPSSLAATTAVRTQ